VYKFRSIAERDDSILRLDNKRETIHKCEFDTGVFGMHSKTVQCILCRKQRDYWNTDHYC